MSSIQGSKGSTWDHDAVRVSDQPGAEIDHAASAKANLSAAGEDLKQAFTPDKSRDMLEAAFGKDQDPLQRFFGALLAPLAIAWDVAELAYQPLLAVKDGADAALHGIASLFRKR